MCLFKKKKKVQIIVDTKYKVGDSVSFRRRGELTWGWIYEIHYFEGQETVYDVQIGGQCPAIIKGINESELHLRKEK